MQALKRRFLLAAATLWLLSGCAFVRESVNWEFKAEQAHPEPQEQRRDDLEYLARPR